MWARTLPNQAIEPSAFTSPPLGHHRRWAPGDGAKGRATCRGQSGLVLSHGRTRHRSQVPGLWGSRLGPRRARGCVRYPSGSSAIQVPAAPTNNADAEVPLVAPNAWLPLSSTRQRAAQSAARGWAPRAAARHVGKSSAPWTLEARTECMTIPRRDVQRTRGIECEDSAEASVPRIEVRSSDWRTEELVTAEAMGGVGVAERLHLSARVW